MRDRETLRSPRESRANYSIPGQGKTINKQPDSS